MSLLCCCGVLLPQEKRDGAAGLGFVCRVSVEPEAAWLPCCGNKPSLSLLIIVIIYEELSLGSWASLREVSDSRNRSVPLQIPRMDPRRISWWGTPRMLPAGTGMCSSTSGAATGNCPSQETSEGSALLPAPPREGAEAPKGTVSAGKSSCRSPPGSAGASPGAGSGVVWAGCEGVWELSVCVEGVVPSCAGCQVHIPNPQKSSGPFLLFQSATGPVLGWGLGCREWGFGMFRLCQQAVDGYSWHCWRRRNPLFPAGLELREGEMFGSLLLRNKRLGINTDPEQPWAPPGGFQPLLREGQSPRRTLQAVLVERKFSLLSSP